MRLKALTMAILIVTGCTDEERAAKEPTQTMPTSGPDVKPTPAPAMKSFEFGERSYTLPAEYVPALRVEGAESFVRIKLPNFSAEIVVDERSSGKADETGAPRIFSINDRDYPGLDYTKRADGQVVICRKGMAAQSGCGTLFQHAGTEWTLLFPRAKRGVVDDLVSQAVQLLNRYGKSVMVPDARVRKQAMTSANSKR